MERLLLPLLALGLACTHAQTSPAIGTSSGRARFANADEIWVALDSASGPISRFGPTPRYPPGARQRGEQAFPVVAFVVDSTGRVERGTASFAVDPGPEFRQAVCEVLPRTRFRPANDQGRPRRAFAVMAFGFAIYMGAPTRVPPEPPELLEAAQLSRRLTEAFARTPRAELVSLLEAMPHCRH